MTQYDQLKAMLDSANIPVSEEIESSMRIVRMEASGLKGVKPEGYFGFVTLFHFNQDGTLNKVGIWE